METKMSKLEKALWGIGALAYGTAMVYKIFVENPNGYVEPICLSSCVAAMSTLLVSKAYEGYCNYKEGREFCEDID